MIESRGSGSVGGNVREGGKSGINGWRIPCDGVCFVVMCRLGLVGCGDVWWRWGWVRVFRDFIKTFKGFYDDV